MPSNISTNKKPRRAKSLLCSGGWYMKTLNTLRKAYQAAFEALVVEYPRQEANRSYHEMWAKEAQLGRLTRHVRTKGGFTDLPKGTLVLYRADTLCDKPALSIWTIGHRTLGTLVDLKDVRKAGEAN
jgi:hypothetical protein